MKSSQPQWPKQPLLASLLQNEQLLFPSLFSPHCVIAMTANDVQIFKPSLPQLHYYHYYHSITIPGPDIIILITFTVIHPYIACCKYLVRRDVVMDPEILALDSQTSDSLTCLRIIRYSAAQSLRVEVYVSICCS